MTMASRAGMGVGVRLRGVEWEKEGRGRLGSGEVPPLRPRPCMYTSEEEIEPVMLSRLLFMATCLVSAERCGGIHEQRSDVYASRDGRS